MTTQRDEPGNKYDTWTLDELEREYARRAEALQHLPRTFGMTFPHAAYQSWLLGNSALLDAVGVALTFAVVGLLGFVIGGMLS